MRALFIRFRHSAVWCALAHFNEREVIRYDGSILSLWCPRCKKTRSEVCW